MTKTAKKLYLIKTSSGTFRAFIWYDKQDKAYLVSIPSLPEICTFGISLADAKYMAKDAVELCCKSAIDEGKLVVDDTGRVISPLPKVKIIELAHCA